MKIILCSPRDSVRERWRSMLHPHGYSLYDASTLQMLESVVHKLEQYILLVDESFMDVQTISTFCRRPDVFKIFVFSDSPDTKFGVRLMTIGVVGYANTYISEGRLLEAVRTIEAGRVWFNQDMLSYFIQLMAAGKKGETATEPDILKDLSEREKEIALLVAKGFSNKDIAEQLFVSERTVKTHLGSIFLKTGSKSRLKLALLILQRSQG